jgi:hypothetical protein
MFADAQSELRTDYPTAGRSLTLRAGSRRRTAHRAGDRPTEPPVTCDRRVLEIKEVLADILACIFAEAQEMGTLEPLSQANDCFHKRQNG